MTYISIRITGMIAAAVLINEVRDCGCNRVEISSDGVLVGDSIVGLNRTLRFQLSIWQQQERVIVTLTSIGPDGLTWT